MSFKQIYTGLMNNISSIIIELGNELLKRIKLIRILTWAKKL